MKVLLIGDSCEDRYFYGDVKRLNPEAPVPILEYKRGVTSNGMVWNVRENLRSLEWKFILLHMGKLLSRQDILMKNLINRSCVMMKNQR